jgi:hypothetical protein
MPFFLMKKLAMTIALYIFVIPVQAGIHFKIIFQPKLIWLKNQVSQKEQEILIPKK